MKSEAEAQTSNYRREVFEKKHEDCIRKPPANILFFHFCVCCYFQKSFHCAVTNITLLTGGKINHTFKWRQMPHPLGVARGYSHNGPSLFPSLSLSLSLKAGSFPRLVLNVHAAQPNSARSIQSISAAHIPFSKPYSIFDDVYVC